jgi:hypothetical protein
MKARNVGFALIAFLLAGALSPAAAAVITFSFTGTVTSVPVDEIGTGIGFGTRSREATSSSRKRPTSSPEEALLPITWQVLPPGVRRRRG